MLNGPIFPSIPTRQVGEVKDIFYAVGGASDNSEFPNFFSELWGLDVSTCKFSSFSDFMMQLLGHLLHSFFPSMECGLTLLLCQNQRLVVSVTMPSFMADWAIAMANATPLSQVRSKQQALLKASATVLKIFL